MSPWNQNAMMAPDDIHPHEDDPRSMTEWQESAMRVWCEELTRQLRGMRIEPHGRPYLYRYFVAGWNPLTKRAGSTMYLHHFVASDPDEEVHSHPWAWGVSLILAGGYREHRCTGDAPAVVRDYHAGDVNVFTAADLHRVELLGPDCWSLLLVGQYQQPWGFAPACD